MVGTRSTVSREWHGFPKPVWVWVPVEILPPVSFKTRLFSSKTIKYWLRYDQTIILLISQSILNGFGWKKACFEGNTREVTGTGMGKMPVMSLPIRYSPMAFYFWLSIIFYTPQVLQHLPHQCNVLRPLRDRYRLYPIPIAPPVRYHVGDLSYDLRTTSLHFPFLVSSLLPDAFFRGLTNHRSSHHVIGTLPYVSPHTNLVLVLLIICI